MAIYQELHSNPADRLLHFVKAISSMKDTENFLESWSRILQINSSNDKPNLYYAVALIEQLPGHVCLAIQNANPDSASLYLSWQSEIVAALDTKRLFSNISNCRQFFTQQNLDLIAICADQLRKNNYTDGFNVRQNQQIDRLYEIVNRYLKRLTNNKDLDLNLKHILIDQLLVLDRSLVYFKVNGSPGNIRAIEQMAGIAAANRDLVKEHSKSPHLRRVVKFAGAYMMAVGLLQNSEWVLDKAKDIGLLPESSIITESSDSSNDH